MEENETMRDTEKEVKEIYWNLIYSTFYYRAVRKDHEKFKELVKYGEKAIPTLLSILRGGRRCFYLIYALQEIAKVNPVEKKYRGWYTDEVNPSWLAWGDNKGYKHLIPEYEDEFLYDGNTGNIISLKKGQPRPGRPKDKE